MVQVTLGLACIREVFLSRIYVADSHCDSVFTYFGKRDVTGLKYPIHERVIFHGVLYVDEVHKKAIKIERLQSRASPFKSVAEDIQQYKKSLEFHIGWLTSSPESKPSDNDSPYYKRQRESIRQDRCWQMLQVWWPKHKSNKCPRRRQVNMADYEDEDEVKIKTEPENSDFAEEHEESATY